MCQSLQDFFRPSQPTARGLGERHIICPKFWEREFAPDAPASGRRLDELGTRAKAELPRGELSRLLRDAVERELERRRVVSETLSEASVYTVELENREGRRYMGRITGDQIAVDRDGNFNIEVYLTDDERVLVYDWDSQTYWQANDPETDLRNVLGDRRRGPAHRAVAPTSVPASLRGSRPRSGLTRR